jgi:malate/lactate dehydrogenase
MAKKSTTIPMIKVGIVGAGRVGGSIAVMLLFHPKVKFLVLNDIDIPKCLAEREDLEHASWILGQEKSIITGTLSEIAECDYIFVCAGYARTNSAYKLTRLYDENFPIIGSIVSVLPRDRVYIVTNPSAEIATNLGVKSLGDALDRIRFNMKAKSGGWILDRKGYTNWGIASEAYRVIK